MPVDKLHDEIDTLLRAVLADRIKTHSIDASVGSNIAVRWDKKHKLVGSDPDLYWQEPALPDDQTSILTWEGNNPPKIVVEIVSKDTADRDYLIKPRIYDAAGVQEFWIIDLKHLGPALDSSGHKVDKRTLRRKGPAKPVVAGPYSLQIYSRDNQGKWARTYSGEGPAFSHYLSAWLIVRENRVRLANDPGGMNLWPTGEERERAEKERALAQAKLERTEKERERAEKELERTEKNKALFQAEHERSEKENALRRVAELEAKLASLTQSGTTTKTKVSSEKSRKKSS